MCVLCLYIMNVSLWAGCCDSFVLSSFTVFVFVLSCNICDTFVIFMSVNGYLLCKRAVSLCIRIKAILWNL